VRLEGSWENVMLREIVAVYRERVVSQKAVISMSTAVRTSNLAKVFLFMIL
jgi:hypothetical protein